MKLLNRLVTNQYLVRFSHTLSEGWNRLSALSGSAKRRRERNRAALRAFPGGGFINGQGRGAVARLPFGNYTMDYNGCEVIACYNALRLLGRELPLESVAAYFETRGIFLGGLWGTHAAELPRFFRSLGLTPGVLYASSARAPGAFDDAFAGARAGVFSFWNDKNRLRSGVHTVALAHGAEGLVIYNLSNRDRDENTRFRSVAEFVRVSGALPVLLVTLP